MSQQDGEWVRLIFTLDIALEIVSCVKYHLNVSLVKKGTIQVKMILVYQDARLHKRNWLVLIVRITMRKHLYAQYTLISQNGTNFLKGSDIYYQFLLGRKVFGGPFVWAQAKFLRFHNIISPHFSVTITFYFVYGSSFPSDGQFIYTTENNITVSKSITNTTSSNTDETKQERAVERILHNTSLLTITWECYGPNNEPVQGFSGFHTYYIIVHNCQPYCLECSDATTCTLWNSTYDSSFIKFSQAECLINQYYHKESVRCLDCPQSCLTCTSQIDCQTCKSTYIQTKLGCMCKMNQYEESGQCFDCPIECNQCLSQTYCIECLISNYREFIILMAIIQLYKMLDVSNVINFAKLVLKNQHVNVKHTLESYQMAVQLAILFKIEYQKDQNVSVLQDIMNQVNCPDAEDSTLSQCQCYKLCNNNQQIWHNITCNSCDIGFQLVSGECLTICGDLQIIGDEQCEDNNTILNDLCYNCQFQCPAHCLICDSSTTLPCPDVFGDGIITGIEDVKMEIQFNKMDVLIVNINASLNVQNVQNNNILNLQLLVGILIQQLLLGNVKKDVEICLQLDKKNARMAIKLTQMDAKIVNFSLELDVLLVIIQIIFDKATNSVDCSGTVLLQSVCGDGQIINDPYRFYFEDCEDRNIFDFFQIYLYKSKQQQNYLGYHKICFMFFNHIGIIPVKGFTNHIC
ncbi:unnamed protein product [Paramecium octaurelia]|uniref:Insulin-like growth factor binding protein, N-terminal n=1 Tax=Paramecium octaurelia TaxID=43137 RepID=A0A8S1YG13_PAROT|nr:unnamed protein product [Paramecium octaurelia]